MPNVTVTVNFTRDAFSEGDHPRDKGRFTLKSGHKVRRDVLQSGEKMYHVTHPDLNVTHDIVHHANGDFKSHTETKPVMKQIVGGRKELSDHRFKLDEATAMKKYGSLHRAIRKHEQTSGDS